MNYIIPEEFDFYEELKKEIKNSKKDEHETCLIDGSKIIAKVSDYGYISNFSEDHSIINALSINLPYPFENFLAKSLTKKGKLYIYEKKINQSPVWVVFYNPIRTSKKPTKKQNNPILSFTIHFPLPPKNKKNKQQSGPLQPVPLA